MTQILPLVLPFFSNCVFSRSRSSSDVASPMRPPQRSLLFLKPYSLLTLLVALSYHSPIYGSSLQPKGTVVGGAAGAGPGGVCGIVVGNTPVLSGARALGDTSLGGPGMCLENVFPNAMRLGDIEVFCSPDAAASPCSGAAVIFSSSTSVELLPTLHQFRIDFSAEVDAVVAGGTISGVLKMCSDITCSAPLQILINDAISKSFILTIPVASVINLELNIDSVPVGTTIKINNLVLQSAPTASEFGVIQVCKTGGSGIAAATLFSFTVQQFTVTEPPVNQVIKVPAGVGTESCSDNLFFPQASLVVVHELTTDSEVVDITGSDRVDILRGTAVTIVRDSPTKLVFTNKILGIQGCGPGYYRNHTNSFPRLVSALDQDGGTVIFGLSQGAMSFFQALREHGGPGLQDAVDLLSRSAATALLNAAHPSVAYALGIGDVVQLASAAFASSDRTTILAASEQFDILNNGVGGCPLH